MEPFAYMTCCELDYYIESRIQAYGKALMDIEVADSDVIALANAIADGVNKALAERHKRDVLQGGWKRANTIDVIEYEELDDFDNLEDEDSNEDLAIPPKKKSCHIC